MTDLSRKYRKTRSSVKTSPSPVRGEGEVRGAATRRIVRILGMITIVALLLGGGVVVPVGATPEVTVGIGAPDQAAPGSDFTASVNISDVVDFDCGYYDVSFDASVLQLNAVTPGLIGSTTIPVDMYWEIGSGTYRIVQCIPGMWGVSGSGYLAVLHFHVIGSAGESSAISLSNGGLYSSQAEEILATWAGDTVDVTSLLPGDANGDGTINALDITKVERVIAQLDAETPGADANQDGNINALDITKTERIVCCSG